MEEKKPAKEKKSLLARWRFFRTTRPLAAKLTIVAVILIILIGGGVIGYATYDYTQHNPAFCNKCHLMEESYETWEKSEHAEVNCHTCHHFTVEDAKVLLVSVMTGMPENIPERPHAKVLVSSWKYCVNCHWREDKEFTSAKQISSSRFHAKHYFMEETECTQCHSYKVHEFTIEEKYCITCHEGRDVHGGETKEVACLNCHTDTTVDLKPGRKKCLFCHGDDESVREELLLAGTLDVTHFQPSEEIIKTATKIETFEKAPMQFECHECHKAHKEEDVAVLKYESCLSCHPRIENVGQHELHLQLTEPDCTQCHQQHFWNVTEEQVETTCGICHGDDVKDPMTFIGFEEEM